MAPGAMEKSRGQGCLDCLCLLMIYPFVAFPLEKLMGDARITLKQKMGPWKYPCTNAEGLAAESNSSTGLKVILPSIGQTGTTSVHWALCRMGLRSYHAEERAAFAYPSMWDSEDPSWLVGSVSRCRPDALFLEPSMDAFPVALRFSPGAKVILTWRDYPSWLGSEERLPWLNDIVNSWLQYLGGNAMGLFGWLDWWDLLTGRITELLERGDPFSCGTGLDFERFFILPFFLQYFHQWNNVFARGSYKMWGAEEGFLGHFNEIWTLTPPGDLLVFDVRNDSWDKLESFLGVSAGEYAKRPFPRPRQANPFSNNILWSHHPSWVITAHLIYLAFGCINFAILLPPLRLLRRLLRWLCRLTCTKRGISQKQD